MKKYAVLLGLSLCIGFAGVACGHGRLAVVQGFRSAPVQRVNARGGFRTPVRDFFYGRSQVVQRVVQPPRREPIIIERVVQPPRHRDPVIIERIVEPPRQQVILRQSTPCRGFYR